MEMVDKILKKAAQEQNPIKKRVLLNQVLEIQPDCPEARKGLLMLGRLGEKGIKTGDFTAIRSYCLNVFDQPERYTPEERAAIVTELTAGPALRACLEVYPDQEAFLKEYLTQVSKEYVRIFMEGDNHRNGSLMSIRLGNHKSRMAGYAANMICQVQESNLPVPFDTLLPEVLMNAFDRCWNNLELVEQEIEKRQVSI